MLLGAFVGCPGTTDGRADGNPVGIDVEGLSKGGADVPFDGSPDGRKEGFMDGV